jgi:hypothetical protein
VKVCYTFSLHLLIIPHLLGQWIFLPLLLIEHIDEYVVLVLRLVGIVALCDAHLFHLLPLFHYSMLQFIHP